MFTPKEHCYSAQFSGNPAAAFGIARTTLLALGFDIFVDSDDEMQAAGPGMHNNQQPPLVGVSTLKLNISSARISAEAILGGVAKMKAFVYLFPPGLMLLLLMTWALAGMSVPWWPALSVLPWFLISPLIARSLERKTITAVDSLVRSMSQAK